MNDQPPRALKFTVFSMGIMIIGGFLWVGGVVISRLTADNPPVTASNRIVSAPVSSFPTDEFPAECREVNLPTNASAKAIKILNNQRGWLVTYQTIDNHLYWIQTDHCGEILQRINSQIVATQN